LLRLDQNNSIHEEHEFIREKRSDLYMLNYYQKLSLTIASYVFQKIFKRPLGKNGKKFIERLSYVFLGTFLASMLTFVLNFVMIRFLGPTEYGIFVLIQVIGTLFTVPMLFGFDTAARHYLPQKKGRNKIISTSIFAVSFISIMFAILYFLFSKPLALVFETQGNVIFYAILFSLAHVFYKLFSSIYSGLFLMKKIAIFTVVNNLIIALFLIIFLFALKNHTFTTPLIAHIAGFGLVAVALVIPLRKYITKFSKQFFSTLVKYGSIFVFINMFVVLMKNIHLIFVHAYLGLTLLGVYGAYVTASRVITNKLFRTFMTVFFPTLSERKDKFRVMEMVNKLSIPVFIFVILLNIGIISLFLFLYGDKYPFYLGLMLLFAVSAALDVIYRTNMWILSSMGLTGAKRAMKGVAVIAVLNIVLNILLIPLLWLHGAVIAAIISNTIFILYFKNISKTLIRQGVD